MCISKEVAQAISMPISMGLSDCPGGGGGGGGGTSPGTANLVSWWEFNEADSPMSADGWTDSHTNNNHLTRDGTVSSTTTAVVGGQAVECNSSDHLHDNGISDLIVDNDFSVGGWCRPLVKASTRYHCVASKYGTNNFVDRQFALATWGATYKFEFRILSTGGVIYKAQADAEYEADTWYHVLGVRSSDIITIYINGVAQAITADLTGVNENNGSVNFRVNRLSSSYGDAIYDEVCLFDDALTQDEIDWLYNAGSGRAYADL